MSISIHRCVTLDNQNGSKALSLLDKIAIAVKPDLKELFGWNRQYFAFARNRLATDLRICENYFEKEGQILEIGSIPPLLTVALKLSGYDILGVDIAPQRYNQTLLAYKLKVSACDIETQSLPFKDGNFRYVLMNEVFEHLRINLIFTFNEIRRVLARGGQLMLSTPNLWSYRGIRNIIYHHKAYTISGSLYDQYDKLRTLGHMGHVREYTLKEITEFLQHFGFINPIVIYRSATKPFEKLICRIMPSLSPFFTLIVEKTNTVSH